MSADLDAVNSCGFWVATFMLLLLFEIRPESLSTDASTNKKFLTMLYQEYRQMGLSQSTVRGAFNLLDKSLPDSIVNSDVFKHLHLVSLTSILFLPALMP
jgi:hypothetical protein